MVGIIMWFETCIHIQSKSVNNCKNVNKHTQCRFVGTPNTWLGVLLVNRCYYSRCHNVRASKWTKKWTKLWEKLTLVLCWGMRGDIYWETYASVEMWIDCSLVTFPVSLTLVCKTARQLQARAAILKRNKYHCQVSDKPALGHSLSLKFSYFIDHLALDESISLRDWVGPLRQ